MLSRCVRQSCLLGRSEEREGQLLPAALRPEDRAARLPTSMRNEQHTVCPPRPFASAARCMVRRRIIFGARVRTSATLSLLMHAWPMGSSTLSATPALLRARSYCNPMHLTILPSSTR